MVQSGLSESPGLSTWRSTQHSCVGACDASPMFGMQSVNPSTLRLENTRMDSTGVSHPAFSHCPKPPAQVQGGGGVWRALLHTSAVAWILGA